jgi:diacylglycerol kinase
VSDPRWIICIVVGLLAIASLPIILAWAGHAVNTAIETALDAMGERLCSETPGDAEEGSHA